MEKRGRHSYESDSSGNLPTDSVFFSVRGQSEQMHSSAKGGEEWGMTGSERGGRAIDDGLALAEKDHVDYGLSFLRQKEERKAVAETRTIDEASEEAGSFCLLAARKSTFYSRQMRPTARQQPTVLALRTRFHGFLRPFSVPHKKQHLLSYVQLESDGRAGMGKHGRRAERKRTDLRIPTDKFSTASPSIASLALILRRRGRGTERRTKRMRCRRLYHEAFLCCSEASKTFVLALYFGEFFSFWTAQSFSCCP